MYFILFEFHRPLLPLKDVSAVSVLYFPSIRTEHFSLKIELKTNESLLSQKNLFEWKVLSCIENNTHSCFSPAAFQLPKYGFFPSKWTEMKCNEWLLRSDYISIACHVCRFRWRFTHPQIWLSTIIPPLSRFEEVKCR